jgi:hypothetical protein
MTNFEKVKNAFSKSTRFLSSRKYLVIFLMLLIAWIFFLCFAKKPEVQSDLLKTKPVKVKCNDPNINHPMASQTMSSWKAFFILFGLAWFLTLTVGIRLTHEFKRIGKGTTFLKCFVRALLWILTLFTGSLYVELFMNNGPTEKLAPNFLAACRPRDLDFLCNPESYPEDWNPVVWVTCTTPAQMWIPALSNSLSILVAVQAYLMVITIFNVWFYFCWKGIWGKISCFLLQITNVGLTVATACLIIFCNEVSFNMKFLDDYALSFFIAMVVILVDFYLCLGGVEDPELPRFWNDVLNKEIIPEKGQLPTNMIPSQYELDNNLATTGPIAGDDDIDANPPPYSKLQPSRNEDPPPDYDKSFSLIQL